MRAEASQQGRIAGLPGAARIGRCTRVALKKVKIRC
jgi:hypothetical protein